MNNDKKIQAATELALFTAQALADLSRGIQYGFGPPRIAAYNTKEAIDAINNLVKLSPCNKDEIELCNKISEFAKCFVDYVENRERW